ncbi:phage tail protein, partial [Aeromonas allosaccharophila]
MQIYKTILTQTGINKLAMAAGATPLRITHMAVGDGNGAETTPNEEQTTLVNEVYRTDINSWEVDPNNPNQRIAEMFLSETVGGWWVY